MNDLVFLSSQQVDAEPFTTGDVIAEYAGIARKSVNEVDCKFNPNFLTN